MASRPPPCTHSYLRSRPTALPPLVSGRRLRASFRATDGRSSTAWPVRGLVQAVSLPAPAPIAHCPQPPRPPLRPSCGPTAPPWRPAALANLPPSPASRNPALLQCCPEPLALASEPPARPAPPTWLLSFCCTVLGACATSDRGGHMAFPDPFPPGATVGGMRSTSCPASRGAAATRQQPPSPPHHPPPPPPHLYPSPPRRPFPRPRRGRLRRRLQRRRRRRRRCRRRCRRRRRRRRRCRRGQGPQSTKHHSPPTAHPQVARPRQSEGGGEGERGGGQRGEGGGAARDGALVRCAGRVSGRAEPKAAARAPWDGSCHMSPTPLRRVPMPEWEKFPSYGKL